MQIALRQSQALAKRSRMFDDTKNCASRAVPSEAAAAILAAAASQVNFAHHAPADPFRRIGLQHFAHKLMAGYSSEVVISALQFQVGIADAAAEQANQRESFGASRARLVARFHASVFEMYRQHA